MRQPILDVRFSATESGRELVRDFLLDMTVEEVLLHAFVKKSPKTPASDMDTAQQRLRRIKGD